MPQSANYRIIAVLLGSLLAVKSLNSSFRPPFVPGSVAPFASEALALPQRYAVQPVVSDGALFAGTRLPLVYSSSLYAASRAAGELDHDEGGGLRLSDIIARARQRPRREATAVGSKQLLLVWRDGIGFEVIDVYRVTIDGAGTIDIYSQGLLFDGYTRVTLGRAEAPQLSVGPENPLFLEQRVLSTPVADFRAWPLTDAEGLAIRSELPSRRPGTTLGLDRSEVVVYVAIQAMQILRLADSGRAEGPGSAEARRAMHFEPALQLLINQFGADAFIAAVRTVMEGQLAGIYMTADGMFRAELNAYLEPMLHSDYVRLAREALNEIYPLPLTLNAYGHPLRLQPLVTEPRFWVFLKTVQPSIYSALSASVPAQLRYTLTGSADRVMLSRAA